MSQVKVRVERWPALVALVRAPYARWAVAVLCLGVMAVGLYRQFDPSGVGSQIHNADFHGFYLAALAVSSGHDPYGPADAFMKSGANIATIQGGNPFVYSPAFAIVLIPFTWLPYPTALLVWDFCNVAMLAGSIYLLLRSIGSRPSFPAMAVLTMVASYTAPVRGVLFWGQSDILILFLLSAALATRFDERWRLASVLLALACVVKPTLLAMVPFLLWKREFRLVAVWIGTFLVVLLAPFVALGGQTWQDQLLIWRFWTSVYVTFRFNFAPMGVLARLLEPNAYIQPLANAPQLATGLWLVEAAIVFALTLVMLAPRPLARDRRSWLDMALIILAFLLISPLTEDNHMALLIAPTLLLYGWLRDVRWRDAPYRLVAIGAAVGLLLLLAPLHSVGDVLWNKMFAARHPLDDVYMVLSATFLYVMVFYFVVVFRATMLDAKHAPAAVVHT